MELRQLKSFLAVARCNSFTRAAEALDYAQSSITAQIQALEAELGTRLFERLGRRVTLTGDGEKLIKYADRILKMTEEAKEIISGAGVPRGTLTIGAPESLCVYRLPRLLQEYRRRFPEVVITIRNGICPEFARWLRGGVLDVAFFLQRDVEIADLVVKTVVPEPIALIAWPGHPLSVRKSVSPPDIQGENLVLTETGGNISYRFAFEEMLARAGVEPGSVTELGSIEAIKKTVISGLGITVLPRIAVEKELAEGLLAELAWQGPEFNMVTQVSYHRDKWVSPALEAFMGMVEEMLEPR